ncbi:MAG: M24 family metallopeptidase, partial [Acidimicrobiia bacterium]|nr:M24 family metallopeptidase [Acidimicrobiia bacterium]
LLHLPHGHARTVCPYKSAPRPQPQPKTPGHSIATPKNPQKSVKVGSEPDSCLPSQWPSTRRVQAGDVLTTEISVNWWGYSGQVLRTMTIDADPTDEYRDLHAVADAAYDAILEIRWHPSI